MFGPRWNKFMMLAMAFVTAIGLSACDTETTGTVDNPSVEQVDDDTGTYGPYIRPNGTLGSGIDMGGGTQFNVEKGTIEFGFGF